MSTNLSRTEQSYVDALAEYLENELLAGGRICWTRVAELAGLSRRTIYDLRDRQHVVAAVMERAARNGQMGAVFAVHAFEAAMSQLVRGLRSGELSVCDLTREHVQLIFRGLTMLGLDGRNPPGGVAGRGSSVTAGNDADASLRDALNDLLASQRCTA